MKVAIIGYGKMGKAIEQILLQRGHTVVLIIDQHNAADLQSEALKQAEVAIEFTTPHTAIQNMQACFAAGVPVVVGTTGWLQHRADMEAACVAADGALLHSTNFSLGVNIFFEINRQLARLMARHTDYSVKVTETHHTAKLDAPSGTAISIAEQILQEQPALSGWVNSATADNGQLPIESLRIDPAPGTHTVTYHSSIDDIEITHTAHSRQGFALGAVLAAEFLAGKKGIFSMRQVLGL